MDIVPYVDSSIQVQDVPQPVDSDKVVNVPSVCSDSETGSEVLVDDSKKPEFKEEEEVREVHQEWEDFEKWFLIREKVVWFGLEEFVLITRVSPEGSSNLNEFKQKMSFKKKIFPDLTIKVIQEQVRGRDLPDLRNIAFGKLFWDTTFHFMNLAFKDGDDIFYKTEKAKDEKDKSYSFKFKGFPFSFLIWLFEILISLSPKYCKRIANTYTRLLNWEITYKKNNGGYSELVSEVFNNPEATVKDFYPVGRELKKSAIQNLKFEPIYLSKKPRGFDGKFSKLELALVCIQEDQKKILLSIKNLKDEFSIKFDEVIELLKSKSGSSVPKDVKDKVEDSCSKNLEFGGNDDELPDPLSPEVVSKFNLPDYDDESGELQLSVVQEDKVHSSLGEGKDEAFVFSDEHILVDQSILGLVDSLTQAYASAISKEKEPSGEVEFDPKEMFPFVQEIGMNTDTDDCEDYVMWIEGARLLKKKNNEKTSGDIEPPFDFSIAQIDDKSCILRTKVFLYNSMKNMKTNQMKILPISLRIDTPIVYEFVDKLPSQSRSDCGVFVYANLFIRDKINEVPPNMDDMIANYRNDLVVTLYNYAQKKINEGYSTEDRAKGKKSKKKNLDSC
uniref:Ubiquitin-like protease family profile domain-containing protein n=1 Tax=Cannabis sativa TaxID=3483 RepID=A0A803PU04_CANSA